MTLTPWDISNLNSAMDRLGNSFVQKRQLDLQQQQADQQRQRDIARQLIEQRMLEAEQRRASSEDARQERLNQPKVSGFIADPDNPDQGIKVDGTYDQLTQIADKVAEKRGKPPMILPDHPRGEKPFSTIPMPNGTTFHTYSQKEHDTIMKQLKSQGLTPGQPDRGGFQTKEIANKRAHDAAMIEADLREQQGDVVGAQKLRDEAEARFGPPGEMVTETFRYPGQEAQPGSPGKPEVWHLLHNEPAIPAVPATPALPARDVTIRHRAGQSVSPPTAASATEPTQSNAFTDRQGVPWLYKGAMADPTQDKNPANWQKAGAAGKVRMISPKGVTGLVPAAQVQAAQAQGYKLAPPEK